MTNLTENPVYETGIFRLEVTTPTKGGPPVFSGSDPTDGHANAQAQQLANRTAYLKQQLDSLAIGVRTEDEGTTVLTSSSALNFVGAGVTATDGGSGETTVTIPGGISGIRVEDEGSTIISSSTALNFAGSGVTVTDAGSNEALVTIPGGITGVAFQDEGSTIVTSATANFVGSNVTVTNVGGVATVTVASSPQTGILGKLASGDKYLIYDHPGPWTTTSANSSAANTVTFNVFVIDETTTFTGVSVNVTIAQTSGTCDFAVYNFLGVGKPGTNIGVATINSASTGVKTANFASPITLTPGIYFSMARRNNPSGSGEALAGVQVNATGGGFETSMLLTDALTVFNTTSEQSRVQVADANLPGGSYSSGMDMTGLTMSSSNTTPTSNDIRLAFIKQ